MFSYPKSLKGKQLAKQIHDYMISDKVYTQDRGLRMERFIVLRETRVPAVLVELGFITNREDAKILRSKQNELAISVAKGILGYLGIKYKEDVNTNEDVRYEIAVKELMLLGIINSPDLWLDPQNITGKNIESLIIKMAAYTAKDL